MSDSNDDSFSDDEEEELDPRIQDELEKLNAATNSINHLEAELDEARAVFRQTLAGATYQLNAVAAKLGKCVEKSRPFYESYRQLKQAHYMLQKSTNQFERASGMHVAARRRVIEAESRVFGDGEKRAFDTALQEMLNQATIEVNEAEKLKHESWKKHQEDLHAYRDLESKVKQLSKKLSSAVGKARPYFELKSDFDKHLWQLKLRVDSILKGLAGAKENYSACLKSLEIISDDIHEKRKSKRMDAMLAKLHEREAGVGADSSNEDEPSLSASTLDLDFDTSIKFDDIADLAKGRSGRKESTSSWDDIQPTVVIIDSEFEPGKIMSPLSRTVTGCEDGNDSLGTSLPSSSRQDVYGHESEPESTAQDTQSRSKTGHPQEPCLGDTNSSSTKTDEQRTNLICKMLNAMEEKNQSRAVDQTPKSRDINSIDGSNVINETPHYIDRTIQSRHCDEATESRSVGDVAREDNCGDTSSIDGTDESRNIGSTNESRNIDGTNESRNIDGTDKSHNINGDDASRSINGKNESRNIANTDESRNIDGTDESRNIEGTNESRNIDGLNESRNIDGTNESHIIASTDESRNIDGQNESRNIANTDESRNIASTDESRNSDGTNESRNIDGTYESRNIDGTNESRNISSTDESQNIDGTDESRNIDNTDESRNIDNTNESRNIDNTDESRNINGTDVSSNIDDTDESRNINST